MNHSLELMNGKARKSLAGSSRENQNFKPYQLSFKEKYFTTYHIEYRSYHKSYISGFKKRGCFS